MLWILGLLSVAALAAQDIYENQYFVVWTSSSGAFMAMQANGEQAFVLSQLHFNSSGFSDIKQFLDSRAGKYSLLYGTLVHEADLYVSNVYSKGNENLDGQGLYLIKDNGIRCFISPCPQYDALRLNDEGTSFREVLVEAASDDIKLRPDLLDSQAGLIVLAEIVYKNNEPNVVRVYNYWLPLAAAL